jgi:uncharacterized protein YndB with AHSA1/START domain
MNNQLTFEKSVSIQAPVAEVWKALTTPSMIKQYLFGTDTTSDWKKGSSITFQGVWQDKSYTDKGTIVDVKPNSFLEYTYWSSFSGIADVPENYSTIRYTLSSEGNSTRFTLTQKGFANAEARDHSASNWEQVMESIKKLVEEKLVAQSN